MDFTSRMTTLLGAFRRERNGAVADAMRPVGRACGLNYGVSLPTIRSLARAMPPDHAFAEYLYRQDVRELRLAALHLADPARLTTETAPFWAAGLLNAEIAEEAAFALISRAAAFPALFAAWTAAEARPLEQYAALMAAARRPDPAAEWIAPAVAAVHRAAEAAASRESGAEDSVAGGSAGSDAAPAAASADVAGELVAGDTAAAAGFVRDFAAPLADALDPAQAAHLIAAGAVALLAQLGAQNRENRQAVLRAAGSLGSLRAEDYVHEELAWRLEA